MERRDEDTKKINEQIKESKEILNQLNNIEEISNLQTSLID